MFLVVIYVSKWSQAKDCYKETTLIGFLNEVQSEFMLMWRTVNSMHYVNCGYV
jgi:hypothetical protein